MLPYSISIRDSIRLVQIWMGKRRDKFKCEIAKYLRPDQFYLLSYRWIVVSYWRLQILLFFSFLELNKMNENSSMNQIKQYLLTVSIIAGFNFNFLKINSIYFLSWLIKNTIQYNHIGLIQGDFCLGLHTAKGEAVRYHNRYCRDDTVFYRYCYRYIEFELR